jgi:hypothetical protein
MSRVRWSASFRTCAGGRPPRHWGAGYDAALRSARTQLVALGGDEGYATFFAFGHSLRG